MVNVIDRFTAKYIVAENGCWIWTAAKSGTGYGRLYPGYGGQGFKVAAHRFSYEHFKGKIPEGMFVCHTCDNRLCVNPAHLFVGSHTDNMNDMHSKGRGRKNYAKGGKHANAKFKDSDIPKIRGMRKNKIPFKVIAEQYNVSEYAIQDIVYGRSWSHV